MLLAKEYLIVQRIREELLDAKTQGFPYEVLQKAGRTEWTEEEAIRWMEELLEGGRSSTDFALYRKVPISVESKTTQVVTLQKKR